VKALFEKREKGEKRRRKEEKRDIQRIYINASINVSIYWRHPKFYRM